MKRLIVVFIVLGSLWGLSQAAGVEEFMERKDMRILIVGGGIGGLGLANSLQNRNIPYDLIERREEWGREGTGIALPANAVWALEKLGFEEELKTESALISAMTFTTDQNELLITEDITGIHNMGAQFRSIHRADLHALLLKKLSPSSIKLGTTITALSVKEPSGEIEVTFNNGLNKTYDLVVGADGIHSQVRRLLFGPERLAYQGLATWRTVISTPEGLQNPTYMLGADTVFLLYPLPKGLTYVYCHHVEPEQVEERKEEVLSKIQRLFGTFKGYVPEALRQMGGKAPHIVPGWIESVPEIRWAEGNVLLIGDASHGCSPMLQQGGAQALEDAWVLGEEIEKGVEAHKGVSEILASFVERRRKRVDFVVSKSDQRIKMLPEIRNSFIKEKGAPNVALFRVLMQENP